MYVFDLLLLLLQQMCVYLIIAWILSKTPLIIPLLKVTILTPHKLMCYVIFSAFSIIGSYLGLYIGDSIANTRAIGTVLSGFLGGPSVGILVGFTGGIHRYSLGGSTASSCMLSTIMEGLIGGLVHRYYTKKTQINKLFNLYTAASATFVAGILQMLIILLLTKPFASAIALVKNIALPMIISNSIGAAIFIRILLDRRAIIEKYTTAFSAQALKIAAHTEGILHKGFNTDNCMHFANIIYQQLQIGAVAITDTEKILAFVGSGADHHILGAKLTSTQTMQAIKNNNVVYVDGNEEPYQCSMSSNCKLGSVLVIPLCRENQQVIGTIKLYEEKNRLFSSINLTLGEGIASLISAQILTGQYERNKQSLLKSETKLLHAQVNPHFLFNALNTLQAVIRKDCNQANELINYLSSFFRKNLKRSETITTLYDEIEHVNAYLQIEKARFREHLQIKIHIPSKLQAIKLPAFSLQPLVENAIKHGTSHLLNTGRISLRAFQQHGLIYIEIKDNAGRYQPDEINDGLGISLVDKRLKLHYGEQFGINILCQPGQFTRVRLRIPDLNVTNQAA